MHLMAGLCMRLGEQRRGEREGGEGDRSLPRRLETARKPPRSFPKALGAGRALSCAGGRQGGAAGLRSHCRPFCHQAGERVGARVGSRSSRRWQPGTTQGWEALPLRSSCRQAGAAVDGLRKAARHIAFRPSPHPMGRAWESLTAPPGAGGPRQGSYPPLVPILIPRHRLSWVASGPPPAVAPRSTSPHHPSSTLSPPMLPGEAGPSRWPRSSGQGGGGRLREARGSAWTLDRPSRGPARGGLEPWGLGDCGQPENIAMRGLKETCCCNLVE